ncbi:cytoplasmic dynein 2 intermediate chain 2-like [Pectinophora gossypiella]|uniref:cytoplasmic dynein 2 intermediate chain 2-like n=1 Tax=Pectinophora gossypiella TaxID=13191 RepID=UPI00214F301D|nr:cytoplasmic dynein 2 intermediate chain 2-like [Pectinophora gossypiella]
MSNLSGFDSEAIGFDSISQNKRSETDCSTQTYFTESGTASQTNVAKDCGSMVTPEELNAEDDILKEYPPPGLNEFLRKVVPSMLEQLDNSDKDYLYQSSDSEDDDILTAKVFQEIDLKVDMRLGAGDSQPSVLGVTWSSAGNSLAVSIGESQHENWCQHDGLIRVYTVKRAEQDKLVHTMDITEKNCVTALRYHPSVSALLAYGSASGEVVLCNLRTAEDGMQLSSPAGCHGSKRVSALLWADPPLANMYLTAQITKTGKRRGASDQILISSGSDGTVNVWQVNANLKIFENVISYNINGSRKMGAPDISCFDYIKTYPLRPSDQKVSDDVFVVGTKTGHLYLCKTKTDQLSEFIDDLDPVYEVLEGHSTCVMDLAFSFQKPGVFASISMDSELRVYDINQAGPLKVLCLDIPISCMAWLPTNPCITVLGLSKPERQVLSVYNVSSGRPVKVEGLSGGAGVRAIAVNQSGTCRIAAGDEEGVVRVYDLPSRRIRLSPEDLEF